MLASGPKAIERSCGFQSECPAGTSSKARFERSASRSSSDRKYSVIFMVCLHSIEAPIFADGQSRQQGQPERRECSEISTDEGRDFVALERQFVRRAH